MKENAFSQDEVEHLLAAQRRHQRNMATIWAVPLVFILLLPSVVGVVLLWHQGEVSNSRSQARTVQLTRIEAKLDKILAAHR